MPDYIPFKHRARAFHKINVKRLLNNTTWLYVERGNDLANQSLFVLKNPNLQRITTRPVTVPHLFKQKFSMVEDHFKYLINLAFK